MASRPIMNNNPVASGSGGGEGEAPKPVFAKVKKYSIVFTEDVHKKRESELVFVDGRPGFAAQGRLVHAAKNRVWQDGYLRHHHYNSKLFLLSSSDQSEMADIFYRPSSLHPGAHKTIVGGGMEDDFILREGEEIEFEGWIVEVGEVVFESETNITQLFNDTHKAKSNRTAGAREWIATQKSKSTPSSSSLPQSHPSIEASSPADSSSHQIHTKEGGPAGSGGTYKGFGIAPPQSYFGGKAASTSSSKSATTKSDRAHPYQPSNHVSNFAPNSHSSSSRSHSTPHPTTPQPNPHSHSSASTRGDNGKYELGTPSTKIINSKAVGLPFRPPAFVRPPGRS